MKAIFLIDKRIKDSHPHPDPNLNFGFFNMTPSKTCMGGSKVEKTEKTTYWELFFPKSTSIGVYKSLVCVKYFTDKLYTCKASGTVPLAKMHQL